MPVRKRISCWEVTLLVGEAHQDVEYKKLTKTRRTQRAWNKKTPRFATTWWSPRQERMCVGLWLFKFSSLCASKLLSSLSSGHILERTEIPEHVFVRTSGTVLSLVVSKLTKNHEFCWVVFSFHAWKMKRTICWKLIKGSCTPCDRWVSYQVCTNRSFTLFQTFLDIHTVKWRTPFTTHVNNKNLPNK